MHYRSRSRRINFFLTLWLFGMATGSVAELTVVYDNGRAKPVAMYLAPLTRTNQPSNHALPNRRSLGAADLRALLPIRSPGLTPGTVDSRPHPSLFARPFFLIGSDERSRRWLEQHRNVLRELGAVGLLVEATTTEDLEAIAEIADGLPITPATGTDIARALGIDHYPFAISGQRLWQ